MEEHYIALDEELPPSKSRSDKPATRRDFELILSDVDSFERIQAAVYGYLFDGMPLECYEPSFRDELKERMKELSATAMFSSDEALPSFLEHLKDQLAQWYIARVDSDTRIYPLEGDPTKEDLDTRVSVETRRLFFNEALRSGALPYKEKILKDSQGPFGSFGPKVEAFYQLWEERLSVSQLISLDETKGELPFASMRDFVLSLLPSSLPIKKPSLQRKHSHRESNALARLKSEGLADFQTLREVMSDKMQNFLEVMGKTSVNSLPILEGSNRLQLTQPREVMGLRMRLDARVPGILALLDRKVAPGTSEKVRAIPAFQKSELEEWGEANELSSPEVDAIYSFVLDQAPKNVKVLESAMSKLFAGAGKVKREKTSLPLHPLLLWDKGSVLDSWTARFLQERISQGRGEDQILIVQTADRIGSIMKENEKYLESAATLSPKNKAFYDWAKAATALAHYPDPQVAFDGFGELVGKVWGDFANMRSYLLGQIETIQHGESFTLDARGNALLALGPGLMEVTWQLLTRGIGEDGAFSEELQMAVEVSKGLQTLLSLQVGEEGFDKSNPVAQSLMKSNDMMLMVMTEYTYYSRQPGELKNAIELYKKSLGATQSDKLTEYLKTNPTFLYSSAKYAYLLGMHENCLTRVNRVTEHDDTLSFYYVFAEGLQKYPGADLLGRKGFAPVFIKEEAFMKEMVRLGVLALQRLPVEKRHEAWQELSLRLQRLQGKLSPSQALNFYLAQAQEKRDDGDFDSATAMLGKAWDSLGVQNGYQARRIEHNQAEIEGARAESLVRVPDFDPQMVHDAAASALVIEHQLSQEEDAVDLSIRNLQRVWEYNGSYFQALLRFARYRVPERGLVSVDRRGKEAFQFPDFEERPLLEWIEEAHRRALQSLQVFAPQSPANAKWAAGYIRDWVKQMAQGIEDPENKIGAILTDWDALYKKLGGKN